MNDQSATPDPNEPKTPMEFLASLPNGPTPEQVAAWKQTVPNNALRGFSPDGKRVYLIRGITGLEMKELQGNVIPNATDPEYEFKVAAVCAAVVWTNMSRTNKLEDVMLRTATAGLVDSLFQIVEVMSDYFAPAQLMQMSFDL